MKKSWCTLFLLLLFCFSGFGQVVDTAAVDSLTNLWNQYKKDGQFELIIESAKKAAESVEKELGKNNTAYAKIIYYQGLAHKALGQYTEAEQNLSEVVAIQENVLGKNNAEYAASVNSLGSLYLDLNNFDRAEQLFIEARNIRENVLGKESPVYASSLNNLAILYYYSGKYEKAEPLYLESKGIRERTLGKEHPDYASSLNNLANLYLDQGMYEKAETLLVESAAIREKTLGKEDPDYATSLLNLGNVYSDQGKFELAAQLFQDAGRIYEKVFGKEHPDCALSMNNLANTYQALGRYEEAEQLFFESITIREKLLGKEHPDYASSVNNLAILYYYMGDFEATERLFLEAHAIREKILGREHPAYAWSLNNLGVMYLQLGNYKKAELFHREALDLRAKIVGKEHSDYGASLKNLAVVLEYLGKYEEAEALNLEAIAVSERVPGKTHPDHAGNLINLADLYGNQGFYTKAEPLYLEAKDIFENKLNNRAHPYYTNGLEGLSEVYMRKGQFAEAESLLLESKSILEKKHGKGSLILTVTHQRLAQLYWTSARWDLAEQHLSEAVVLKKHLFAQASGFLSEQELGAYTRTFEQNLHQFFSFAGQPVKATPTFMGLCFDNILFYKGFLLDASNKIKHLSTPDSVTAEKFEGLKSCLRRLEKEYSKTLDEQKNIAVLEEQANGLEKELARTVAGFDDAIRQVNWTEVQSALHPGEAAIEFIHFNYHTPEPTDTVLYAALLLKPGMPHPRFIPLCSEKDLTALLPPSGGLNTDQVNALYGAAGPEGNELYRHIWAPLEQELQGVRLVYCALSGLLHRLHLGAIPAGSHQTVADRFQVITLGSTRQLVFDGGAGRARTTASAIVYGGIRFDADSTALQPPPTGDPDAASRPRGALAFSLIDSTLRGGHSWPYLKWSDKEADNIRAVLARAGIATEVRKGAAATEESFKQIGQSGPSPRILHVSTHGYFFPDPAATQAALPTPHSDEPVFKLSEHPMIRSGLILAGANQAWSTGAPPTNREDGVLTAYEISQLDLRHTELVVLSACETGLGDIQGNEGVYGLQRAFKIAGVRHVMMSLWQVPDYQTQELMTVFYQKMLVEQLPVRQALRAAQDAMRAKRYEPYYWAGFVIVE